VRLGEVCKIGEEGREEREERHTGESTGETYMRDGRIETQRRG
jgi:hypothetical protein